MSIAKYYPYTGKKGRLHLGLSSLPVSEWIQYENDFTIRVQDKKRLIKSDRKRVLDSTKGSIIAQQELFDLLIQYLQEYRSDIFKINKDSVVSIKEDEKYWIKDYKNTPLELISYLAPDDFCVLEPCGDDYRLVAASLCTPTWWSLFEKMGKPLQGIHSPIANLEERIGRMIRYFLKNLSPGDCFQRSNWFLFSTDDLCVFPNSFNMHQDLINVTSDNLDEKLFLRSERQTFRKLPNTGAVVFGIKIYISPISIVKSEPAIAEDLIFAIKELSMQEKKRLFIDCIEDELIAYLQKAVS